MRSRWIPTSAVAALAIAIVAAGCGDGNNNDNTFTGATATPHGGHTAAPTPVATNHPGATATQVAVATASATAGTEATPSATTAPEGTPTPAANACVAGDQIVVTESLDATFGGATVDLKYPASVNIPGTGSASSVTDRVHFNVSGGLTSVNDHGSNGGATDDTLSLGFVSQNDNPAGTFATITFDCVTGEAPPSASDFTCTVTTASDSTGGVLNGLHCTLGVTGP